MTSRPNVVWLTLDSVRSDRTTMGGHGRDTTPHLAGIARRDGGQAFTQCIAHAMWSLPSDASVLTGLTPAEHGTGLWNEVLPEDVTTVPERFADLGYRTAGISQNAYCSDSTGLSRGFERFEWIHRSNLLTTVGPRILLRYLLGLRTHSAGYTSPPDRHRSEFLAMALAKRWLRSFEGGREPFFLFVHTQGAHLPYSPPLPDRDTYADELELPVDRAVEVAYDRSSNYYREIARGGRLPPEEQQALEAMYDGLLSSVDRRVGDLFAHLRSLELGPTVFVVTADHGDLLGEQGIIGHQFSLHDGLVNVPLVVHGLSSLADLPSGTLLQHHDAMRALLREAGAEEADLGEFGGLDPRDDDRQFALSERGNETYETATEQVLEHEPSFDPTRFHPGLLHAVRSDRYKFLQSDRAERLYALPDEETDVLSERPAVAETHRTFLEETLASLGRARRTAQKQELTDAMREQLTDLGYVVD